MQTFLPHRDFTKTASRLDRKRLIKQSVENLQVLKSLAGLYQSAWKNHPAVRMWDQHEDWLFVYNEAIIKEILLRGYKNSTREKFDQVYQDHFWGVESDMPWWLGDDRVHYSHRGRLYEKDSEKYYFYSDFAGYRNLGYTCCVECNYFWPTHMEKSESK
jgi:hypothetical protein